MEQNIDKFRIYLISILNKHNFFQMKETYFNKFKTNVSPVSIDYEFSEKEINQIKSWDEALAYCNVIKRSVWPIFRTTYGRDRTNNGKALLEKVNPFMNDLNKIIVRLEQLTK